MSIRSIVLLGCAISFLLPEQAAFAANVCSGKVWVSAPIIALGGDGEGIGGTGHGPDDHGIGGTGHGPVGIGGTGHGGDDVGIGGTGHSAGTSGREGSGIGGTGHGGSGIGGTGALAHTGEEGLGGTGRDAPPSTDLARDDHGLGGTGIVGIVAGFGSICVNGLEVHYGPEVPTSMDGLAASSRDLALGQSVTVRARLVRGEYVADEIAVLHEVAGPVAALDVSTGTIEILGQKVALPPTALPRIRLGQRLAVSGSRLPDGTIQATRVASSPETAAVLLGTVTARQGSEAVVSGLAVRLPPGVAMPSVGLDAQLRGRMEGGMLVVDRVLENPRLHFTRPVRDLVMLGHVRSSRDGKLDVEGASVSVASSSRVAAGELVEIRGRVHGERGLTEVRVRIEHVERPERTEERLREGFRGERTDDVHSGRNSTESVERPESTHSEVERPETAWPEVSRPETERPEVSRPETERPEVNRPETERPEVNRPELDSARPEVARPEVVRPEIVRPEVQRPEIPELPELPERED